MNTTSGLSEANMSESSSSSSGVSPSSFPNKDTVIKKQIESKIVAAIKELQADQSLNPSEEIPNCPASNALCYALEAL